MTRLSIFTSVLTSARVAAALTAAALVFPLAACGGSSTDTNGAQSSTAIATSIGAAATAVDPAANAQPASNVADTSANQAGQAIDMGTPSAVPAGGQSTGAQATPPPTPDIRQSSGLPTGTAGTPIVARVNGQEITFDDYQRGLARFEAQQIAVADDAALRGAVLNTLIEQVLIDQAAAAQAVVVTPEEVEAEYQANAALAGGAEAWAAWLAENRYTEDEFRQDLRATLITARMRDQLTSDLGDTLLQVHARHILVADRDLAQELITRLGNGEDFATLAAQYSNDVTTRENGGDLGWFAPEELLEPVLAQIAFTLQPNAIAGPVQSSLGYHVLQVLERGERTLSEAKRAELAARRFENWLDTLTTSAQIELYI